MAEGAPGRGGADDAAVAARTFGEGWPSVARVSGPARPTATPFGVPGAPCSGPHSRPTTPVATYWRTRRIRTTTSPCAAEPIRTPPVREHRPGVRRASHPLAPRRGTPDITSVPGGTVELTGHRRARCATAGELRATLEEFTTWHASPDRRPDRAPGTWGVRGDLGDRLAQSTRCRQTNFDGKSAMMPGFGR